MARPRKPTQLKVIQGTAQKCRMNPEEPDASPDTPVAPSYLRKKAREHFNVLVDRLEEMGLASASFTEVIALAALNFEHIGSRDFNKANKARQAYRMCLVEMGLTPASKSKVSGKKKETPKQGKWASLVNK